MEKCPYCGNISMGEITPETGTSYVLTEVDTSQQPAVFIPTSGLTVKPYGCHKCKGILLKSPSIKFIPSAE